jgi:hypothetical protein
MARRIELGAGLAAAVLMVITLAVLLSAPIVAICPVAVNAHGDCPTTMRYITLLVAGKQVSASAWFFIIGMAVVTLVGGIGAALHGTLGRRIGLLLMWPAAILAFAGCATVGLEGNALLLFYLPPVVALCLAAYAGYVAQRRRALEPPDGTDAPRRTEQPTRWFGRGELS